MRERDLFITEAGGRLRAVAGLRSMIRRLANASARRRLRTALTSTLPSGRPSARCRVGPRRMLTPAAGSCVEPPT